MRRFKSWLMGDDTITEFAVSTLIAIWFIAYTLTGNIFPWL